MYLISTSEQCSDWLGSVSVGGEEKTENTWEKKIMGKLKRECGKVIEHSTRGLVFDQKPTSEKLQEFSSRMKFYSNVNLESWE